MIESGTFLNYVSLSTVEPGLLGQFLSKQKHLIEIVQDKVLMQGMFIAVAYTLRTYWNQFSLGGICNQE